MGTALAHVLAQNESCHLWTPDPVVARSINEHHRHPAHFADRVLAQTLVATPDLAEAIRGARLVLVAVGSRSFRSICADLAPLVRPGQAFLSATKALDPVTHLRMSEVLREVTRCDRVGALAGNNVTTDIMAGKPSPIVVASASSEVVGLAREVVRGHPLVVE